MAMLINSIYNVVDRMFIGQGVGALAISGLGFTLPFMALQTAFGTLIGAGASARMSIVLGKKDLKWAEDILGNSIILTFIFSGGFSLISFLFMDPILVLLGASPATIPFAKEYLSIILPGVLFTSYTFIFSHLMRASGHPTKSMMVFVGGAILNTLLDALFIFGFGWGIKGAAFATVISMMVAFLFAISHFFSPSSVIRLRWSAMKIRKRILLNILSIGIAPFLMNLVASVISALFTNSLMKYGGDLAVGAFGIINGITLLIVMTVMGLCQGMQPIAGYNYGAKRMDRVKQVYHLAVIIGSVITTIGFIGAVFFPEYLCRLFTTDEELIAIAAPGMRYVMMFFPFVGFQIVTGNLYQALGRAGLAIFMSLSRQIIFLIPALYICSSIWHLQGVWIAPLFADALAVLVSIALIWKYRPY